MKDVYIDSFNSFTGSEYRVIKEIIKGAENITITVNSLPEDDRDCNTKPNECRKTLLRLAKKQDCTPVFYNTDRQGRLPSELDFLQKNIFRDNKEKYAGCVGAIKLVEASDPMDELEGVFEDILRYVKNDGGRYRDCVICAEDIEMYSGIIKGLSEKLGVPCFTSKRYALSSRGAIRAIKLIPNLFRFSFRVDDVCEFVKTGFSSVSKEESLALEEYIKTWNINGKKGYLNKWKMNPEGRVEGFDEDAVIKLSRLNEIREKFITPLKEFEDKLGEYDVVTVENYLTALVALLVKLDFPGKLEKLGDASKNRSDSVTERQHRHTWEQICDCFDGIYDGAGELDCSHENFSMLFNGVVTANDTGVIPTSADEVLTGNALMLRPHNAKRVYIIGVNDGVFPKASSGGSIFTDGEISILKKHQLDIETDGERQLYDDLFSFYSVACVASEYLQVSYHLTGMNGESMLPSEIIDEFTNMFETVSVEKTEEKSISRLLYIKETGDEDTTKLFDNTISQKLIKKIYKEEMYLSQSKIDRFVMCPFSYNCSYVLYLREEKSPEIKQDLFGTIIHMVLEKYLKVMGQKEGGIASVSREEAKKTVDAIVDDYARESGCDDEDDIRIRHLLRRVKYTVLLLVCDLSEEFKQSKFTPRAFEIPVGFPPDDDGISVPGIKMDLGDDTTAVLRGYIDRLDSYKTDRGIYIRIIDYKTGEKDLTAEDIEKGLNIQMLLYMKCICDGESSSLDLLTEKEKGQSYLPAGVLYHISKRPKKENGIVSNVKRNGILLLDKEILSAMESSGEGRFIPYKEKSNRKNNRVYEEKQLNSLLDGVIETVKNVAKDIKSGNSSIAPLKTSGHDGCKYCKMAAICRREFSNDIDTEDE